MLLVGHLALPLAIRRRVGAVGIEERVTAAQRAVAHHHDPLVAALDPVKHFHGDVIEAVSNHRFRPARTSGPGTE